MKAIAKTNLFLEITGTRKDGYHDLVNVFCPIQALSDEVALAESNASELHVHVDGTVACPADDSNLCMKAATAFCQATGLSPAVDIRLTKNIPVAAGLGGGSSDAAATLRLLNDATGMPLPEDALHGLAARLGADVPYFLHPDFMLGKGIGDILSPCPVAVHFALLLLLPGFPLPVAWSFNHAAPPEPSAPSFEQFLQAAKGSDIHAFADALRNDLEPAVFRKFPMLAMMRQAMLSAGALAVHVSGSGPSLFAVVEPLQAQNVADAVHRQFPQFAKPIIQIY